MNKLLKSTKLILGAVAVFATLAFSGSASAYTYNGLLKQGHYGPAVASLQSALGVMADGKFGPMTKAAVMSYQASRGLTADGVVGPMTGASLASGSSAPTYPSYYPPTTPPIMASYPTGCALSSGYSATTGLPCWLSDNPNLPIGCITTIGFSPMTGQSCSLNSNLPAGCASKIGFSPTTGVKCDQTQTSKPANTSLLQGGTGSITVNPQSTYNGTEIGEGQKDKKVLAFEVKADNGSDVQLTSIKVELLQSDVDASTKLTRYAKSVSIWIDDQKIGEAEAVNFSESNRIWTKSIALNNDAIIKAGKRHSLAIAITALSNIDSANMNTDNWQADVLNIRFKDAEGFSTTENTDSKALEKTFDFKTFASANNVELKVALNNENINESRVINYSSAKNTKDVAILSFSLRAKGNSDIKVREIPVLFTTTGETNESVILTSAHLSWNGKKIATKNVANGGAVVFDSLDINIKAGETEKFTVLADIRDGSKTDDGDTVKAEIGGSQVDAIEAEDESGEELKTNNLTGTAIGKEHTLYDKGIIVSLINTSSNNENNKNFDQANLKITFTATAFDADIYIDRTCVEDGNQIGAGEGISYTITNPEMNSTICYLSSSTTVSGDNAEVYKIIEGDTRAFTLMVIANVVADNGNNDHFASITLEAINWGIADDNTNINFYTFNLNGFRTEPVFLNDI